MRLAVSELERFYAGPLGPAVERSLTAKFYEAWGQGDRLRIAGYGYAQPYLRLFTKAERLAALCPAGSGVRAGGPVPAVLVDDYAWPLPDASIDRLLIVHGLEEATDTRRLLREVWRVLTDDGLVIFAVANRRGPWSLVETSPFAAGRPFSRRQLDLALKAAMFAPTAYAAALHFPPIPNRGLLRLAPLWDRLGDSLDALSIGRLLPNIAGVNLVEARKTTSLPIGSARAEVLRPGLFAPGGRLDPSGAVARRDEDGS
ncbi:hypothetical protein PB2503_02807 [Parvularcula bermudensis HTCC2503]|uniref:Methyltransferase type 11 domain-containing protein n=1 Tax=Parvularcula bermudensis (strain ATCC BAA-594 / HTCC2503 / KCTC 12087) TaxID=314260 RepID=E0TCP9_PARBH|nr:methyltransferase domain-containing protein [Parvularcula bermudensis]ADM08638.1 hypothetical protein PB2503_02807 [Parvularcula bermudensis HTCC2503]